MHFFIMKNLRKRTYISRDVSFLKNEKPLKKIKVNKLEYESQSPINWNEVKISLDATVVEKYLKNKKSVNGISITTPINNEAIAHLEKESISRAPRANNKINNVFSQRNNVMVKLEIPEDFQFIQSEQEQILDFVDVPIKQENYISVSDTDIFSNYLIENANHDDGVFVTKPAVEVALKNKVLEAIVPCEKIAINPKCKHPKVISKNDEVVQSTNQRNSIASGETSEPTIRRSNRKRKIYHNCDNCDHELVKKTRTPSNVKKKFMSEVCDENSNDGSKTKTLLKGNQRETRSSSRKFDENSNGSKSRTLSKTRQREITNPRSKNNVVRFYYCDYCGYRMNWKNNVARHIHNKHLLLFCNWFLCSYCKKKYQTMEGLKKHEENCIPQCVLKCKFCSASVISKHAMKEHLLKTHTNELRGKSRQQIVDEIWYDSVKDVITALEREKNIKKLMHFVTKVFRDEKYYCGIGPNFIKFYCNKCNKSYERFFVQRKKCCPYCNTQLLYQCVQCKITRPHYQAISKHLRSKDSDCDISKNLSIVRNEERLMNMTNKDPLAEESQQIYICELCDYQETTMLQLYEHIVSKHMINNACKERSFTCSKCGNKFRIGQWRFKKHEEFCGSFIRFPCRFCPVTCSNNKHMKDHLSSVHADEIDGKNIENVIEEIITFRNTMKEVNLMKFKKKYSEIRVAGETTDNPNYYLKGITSILKPFCVKCNVTVSQLHERCIQCRTILIFQCLRCSECFTKYATAWKHVTQICKNKIFALVVGNWSRDLVSHKASVSRDMPTLFHCDHCIFKNASKSVLNMHIMQVHKESSSEMIPCITCSKCNRNFHKKEDFSYHKSKCRINYIYNCYLCTYSSKSPVNMKEHVVRRHSHYFHGHGSSLKDIILKIVQNRRIDNKSAKRYTQTGRKQCSKCQSKLMMVCKICEKIYSSWTTIANHFSKNMCHSAKSLKIPSHQLDHCYASKTPPDHSYASNFNPLVTADGAGNS
ncbi:uncharacterized protein LOC131670925 isoform X2 [Phymastichus coffea]|uniref:uncharacterized protein LOC131670925 isoform X2 n=1 Tax=Phymastichus coffea TaxID=108790 RepID=UPI00273AF403|nr:uncharacterized protein LOC131670925 isoform X2 [Phymastichus coffea]